ncbi:MAG: preprotein translocase subunit SecG [Clostridiales bacterium]|nr:MAG: preprotein translocase subunit SecG [Clostridiales bacterium]
MTVFYWIIMSLFILSCIVLIVSILMQSAKTAGLSGSIGGGAQQLFGKQKGRSLDSLFNKITKIAAVVFIVSAVALLLVQKYIV